MKLHVITTLAATLLLSACGKTEFSSTGASTRASSLTSEQSVRETAADAATASEQNGGTCGGPADLFDPLYAPGAASLTDAEVLAAIQQNLRSNVANVKALIAKLERIAGCEVLLRINRQLLSITSDMLSNVENDPQYQQFSVNAARNHPPAPVR